MSRAPLVLLHGWGMTPGIWNELRARFSSAVDVLAPALPGHGGGPSAEPALEAWSDAAAARLPDAAVVCGWSLGGSIALDLARRHPRKVARLILIGASPCFVARTAEAAWPHGLDATVVHTFIEGFATDPAAMLRRFIALQALGDARRRAVTTKLEAAPRLPVGAMQEFAGNIRAALADGLRILADTDLRNGLGAIDQPALMIHGARDALMPLPAAEWLAAQLPGARLERFDGCGHAPFLSRPAECAALIEGFALG